MRIQRIIQVKRLDEGMQLITDCKFDCKLITSIDGGQNFYHCGVGRFCQTELDAVSYINEKMGKETVKPGFMDDADYYQTEVFQFPHDKEIE